MEPLNYAAYQQGVQQPFEAAAQGYGIGATIRDDQLKQQQQQAALQQQQQQRAAIQGLISNPSAGAADYANAITLFPTMREPLAKAWEMKSVDQQQSTLKDAGQWYAAIQNKQPELAVKMMRERAESMKAAGASPQEIKALEAQAGTIEAHPEFGRTMMGMMLASVPGGDKVLTGATTMGTEQRAQDKAPVELRKLEGEADKAGAEAKTEAVKAKYADSAAIADLEKKGWDITKIKEDIKIAKEDNRIKAMNAAISREGNDLKRQELKLKIADTVEARDAKIRERVSTAEAGAANIDNMLNTVERIKTNKSLNDVVGSVEGKPWYPNIAMSGALGNADEKADAIALIETLGSQAFLAQIPNIKGMGALSNAEGEKLQSALTNLSRVQSEKQFRANLDEASRLLKKSRENLSRSTGIPIGKPDTPAAPGSRPPLDSFQK